MSVRPFTIALIITMGLASTSMAQTVTGKWVGGRTSTLTILSDSRVKYCVLADCIVREVVGDTDSQFGFGWNDARFRFVKTGSTYVGTYFHRKTKSAIVMK